MLREFCTETSDSRGGPRILGRIGEVNQKGNFGEKRLVLTYLLEPVEK